MDPLSHHENFSKPLSNHSTGRESVYKPKAGDCQGQIVFSLNFSLMIGSNGTSARKMPSQACRHVGSWFRPASLTRCDQDLHNRSFLDCHIVPNQMLYFSLRARSTVTPIIKLKFS